MNAVVEGCTTCTRTIPLPDSCFGPLCYNYGPQGRGRVSDLPTRFYVALGASAGFAEVQSSELSLLTSSLQALHQTRKIKNAKFETGLSEAQTKSDTAGLPNPCTGLTPLRSCAARGTDRNVSPRAEEEHTCLRGEQVSRSPPKS